MADIVKGIEHVGADVAHGVAVVVADIPKIIKVGEAVIQAISDARSFTPQFKTALALLIDDVKAFAVPLAPVIAAGGQNPVADVAAVAPLIADVIKLAHDFNAFLPTLELALAKIKADTHWA